MVLPVQGFGQKALGGGCIAFGREEEVDGRAGGIHRAVSIRPLVFVPDIRLIHPPRVVGCLEPLAQSPLQFRGVALDPPPDRDVIGVQAPLGQQLLDVTVRQ